MPLKLAIVVQRYGTEIVGGAELHTRLVAEKLVGHLGWEVDVYTTTALDYQTWANVLPAGTTMVDGIRVHRFDSVWQRAPFFGLYDRLSRPWMSRFRRRTWTRWLAKLLEKVWVILQGPYCPGLLRALKSDRDQYRKILFVTYLYYPTLAGVRLFPGKAILLPLAHDEPPFHFLIVEEMLRGVQSIICNTEPEKALIAPKLGGKSVPIDMAGVGFDEDLFVPSPAATDAQPYVLYLGRISAGKGVAQLIDWFGSPQLRAKWPELKLCLAGHLEDSVKIPNDERFVYLGFVGESAKLELMREARAVINPSPHESLSMIVIEALALEVPVVVNGHCEVLRYYTDQVATAFAFFDAVSFEQTLSAVLATDWQSAKSQQELHQARNWALQKFSWSHITNVFERHVRA